ncbi:MAG: hypothetical protein WCL44_00530 [bacterium]
MKSGPYFVVLLLGVACVSLAVALMVVARSNQKLQARLQLQQQALSQGILGPRAQQISSGVLLDLVSAAEGGNTAIRDLLQKHGYNVPASKTLAPAAAADVKQVEKNTTTVTEVPKQ